MNISTTNYYCYKRYSDTNWDNIKITWKGIKPMLSIKPNPSDIPEILTASDSFITNPVEIANVFNNHFSSVASKLRYMLNVLTTSFQTLWKTEVKVL